MSRIKRAIWDAIAAAVRKPKREWTPKEHQLVRQFPSVYECECDTLASPVKEKQVPITPAQKLEAVADLERFIKNHGTEVHYVAWYTVLQLLKEKDAEIERLRNEVQSWRWLHWGHPESSWACPCGNVMGHGMGWCSVGHKRPAKPEAVPFTADEGDEPEIQTGFESAFKPEAVGCEGCKNGIPIDKDGFHKRGFGASGGQLACTAHKEDR